MHNGDFANYARVTKYLRQRNIAPLFLTDTEVSVLLFDLLRRTYGYPLEYVIEAMAPTTERDFHMLPPHKQDIYRRLQAAHIHGSPDGPWFFIIARREHGGEMQLMGITDTSMLRPQVFAIQEGEVSLGLIASEKQAIDAVLQSLHEEDNRVCSVADRYWNARGGSYSNGGSFLFSLRPTGDDVELTCEDKFGRPVRIAKPMVALARNGGAPQRLLRGTEPEEVASRIASFMRQADRSTVREIVADISGVGMKDDERRRSSLHILTRLLDRPYPLEACPRSWACAEIQGAIDDLLGACDSIGSGDEFERIDWEGRRGLNGPSKAGKTLVVDASGFPPEDEEGASRFIAEAHRLGWKRFVVHRLRGQRFVGCGLGPSSDAEVHIYGSSGDYLASGLDGGAVYVHGNAQDQVAQIMKGGRLVIHGDVGQTFMYGAKGGEVYVLGNAAGRPLINAVGRPKVVVNGTALDYLAESFMAGNPLEGGGFIVLNGLKRNDLGYLEELGTPYEGGNLFSLASGGALYIRDPARALGKDQLNGGRFADVRDEDWDLIYPILQANEELLGIPVEALLTHGGRKRSPKEVYRKIEVVPLKALIPAHD